MTRSPRLSRLRLVAGEDRGATIAEFAIVAPVFFLLLFGIFDIGHSIYTQSVLQGAVQDAGRDAGLESGGESVSEIDQYVRDQVAPLTPNGEFSFERANYLTFSDVGRPEDFVDSNDNELYDDDECFTDENGNELWDDDVGAAGLGGADDVVLYTVTVEYDRVFPLWALVGFDPVNSVSATTTLRNQPFGTQAGRTSVQVCPEE